MPRTYTTAQFNAQAAKEYEFHARVDVQDADGVWRDFSQLGGYDWLKGAQWVDSIDTPAMEGVISFLREHYAGGSIYSLAPYMVQSALNTTTNFVSSPAVKGGRGIQAFVCYTAPGVGPTPADWIEVFNGYIHDPQWGGDEGLVGCQVRDLGGFLMAQWTEAEVEYSDAIGQPFEVVLQAILDANPSAKLGPIALYTPVSPGANLRKVKVPKKPVLLALRDLANQIGWDCKFRYDAANQFRLTFFDPGRTKTVPDYILPESQYLAVESMNWPTDDIRNKIKATAFDGVTGAALTSIAEDPASQDEFGLHFMGVDEGATTAIDSQAELDVMTAAMLSDLSRPFATARIRAPFFWIAQTGDLIGVPGNGVEFDTQQNLAVVQIDHVIDEDGSSALLMREQVAGAYKTWLQKENPTSPPAQPPTVTARYTTDSTWLLADPFITPTSPTGEKVSLNYKDDGYYGVDLWLCISATDFTRRWVDSGTELGPTDFWTDGVGSYVLATYALIPGVPFVLQFQAIGQRSGLLSQWVSLTLEYQAPLIQAASLALIPSPFRLHLIVTAGQRMQSVAYQIRNTATPGGGTLLASGYINVATGSTVTQDFALTLLQIPIAWWAHLTPVSAPGAPIGAAVGPTIIVLEGTSYLAPTFADLDAEMLVSVAPPNVPSARVIANTTTVAFDFTVAGVATPYVPDAGITPLKLAARLRTATIQYPFGNGATMGIAGDWLAANPDVDGTALRWKVRALDAARAQTTVTATFSVKKVRESDGALIDMVTGVLSITGASEASGSATGWAVPGFLQGDEIIVTLESITPGTAVSLLFTLTVEKV
jgi:hypothetical protein